MTEPEKYLSSRCLMGRHGQACIDQYGLGYCSCECHPEDEKDENADESNSDVVGGTG